MEIRRATESDWKDIQRLIQAYPEKLMQDYLPDVSAFFVALENEQIVGCCALDIYSKRLAEIRSLAVAKEFQERGIAKALIEACINRAKSEQVHEVLAITGADSLFAKYGFGTFNNEKFALIKILS